MISIDLRDRRPLYEQIIEKFEMLIFSEVLKENDSMPSVRNLATTLAINPNTIQKAYAFLENEGFIYTVSGKGSFVSKKNNLIEKKQMEIKNEIEKILNKAKLLNVKKNEIQIILDEKYCDRKE